MFKRLALPILVSLVFIAPAQAGVTLIASGALNGTSDLSGLSGALENGVAANVLGGMGSGLAWAGGNTFLALPDRGPNASSYAGGGAIEAIHRTEQFVEQGAHVVPGQRLIIFKPLH